MLHFVRRRLFFGCALGFIAFFAAGSLANGAEGESRIKTARKKCRTIIAEGLDSENAQVRVAAVRAVGEFLGGTHKFDGDRPEDILKTALRDQSLQVAYAAAKFLPDNERAKKVIERYVNQLADKGDPLSRLERIRLLRLDEELEYVKKKALSAEDTKVRTEAIRTLAVLGGADAIATIMKTYKSSDKTIKVASRNALWASGFKNLGEATVTRINRYVHSEQEDVRQLAAVGMRERIEYESENNLLRDANFSYSRQKDLWRLLRDNTTVTRRVAAEAIGAGTNLVGLTRRLYDRLQIEKDGSVRIAIAGALLGLLNTRRARIVEREHGIMIRSVWAPPLQQLVTKMAQLSTQRGEGIITLGHLLTAFGQSKNPKVKRVLAGFGLSQKSVTFSGKMLLSSTTLRKLRLQCLGHSRRSFDGRTMIANAINDSQDKLLIVPWHFVRLDPMVHNILITSASAKRQKRGVDQTTTEMVWQSVWETLNREKAQNKVKAVGVFLKDSQKTLERR